MKNALGRRKTRFLRTWLRTFIRRAKRKRSQRLERLKQIRRRKHEAWQRNVYIEKVRKKLEKDTRKAKTRKERWIGIRKWI